MANTIIEDCLTQREKRIYESAVLWEAFRKALPYDAQLMDEHVARCVACTEETRNSPRFAKNPSTEDETI